MTPTTSAAIPIPARIVSTSRSGVFKFWHVWLFGISWPLHTCVPSGGAAIVMPNFTPPDRYPVLFAVIVTLIGVSMPTVFALNVTAATFEDGPWSGVGVSFDGSATLIVTFAS